MDRSSVVGDWDIGFRELAIMDQGDMLLLTCPDGPPGYEGRLIELEADRFRIEGGPLHGAELVLGEDGPSLGGHRPLSRLDRPARALPGSGLAAPALEAAQEEEEAFEHLWNWIAHPSRAPEVDPGGVDVCRFLQWTTAHQLALFHGANSVDLLEFEPGTWPTVSMGDAGFEDAVVANQDGLCSMFGAVVDEEVSGRSARHRVERFYSPEGGHVDVYHFSMSRAALDRQPFRTGGLYLLPRERFRPVSLYPGGPASTEWVSPDPVRPLACLIVTPDDFPLLGVVGSYE